MSNLTRYDLEWFNRTNTMDNFHQMVASDEGAWVKFDDIKELLNSSHNISRDAIANAITEGIRNNEFSGEITDRVLKVISQQHPC